MRRLSKTISIVLSLALLVNIAGVRVSAEDAADTGQKDGITETVESAEGQESEPAGNGEIEAQEDPGETEKDQLSPDGQKEPDEGLPAPQGNIAPAAEQGPDAGEPDGDGAEREPLIKIQESGAGSVKVSPNAANNGLDVEWDKVTAATEYKVTVSKKDGGSGDAAPQTVEAESELKASFKVGEGIEYGTAYTIKVEYKTSDIEAFQEVGSVPAILLQKPAVTTTAGNGTVTVAWEKTAGATGYKVQCVGGAEVSLGEEVTSYIFKGLTNGKTYTFRVTAQHKFEDAVPEPLTYEASAEANAAPVAPLPGQVKNLSGMDGEKSAILTWSAVTYATSYIVQRYDKTWKQVAEVTGTSYTNTGLQVNKTYQYRVLAKNTSGTGTASGTVSVSVKKTPGTKIKPMSFKVRFKSKAKAFKTSTSKKKVRYIKKGTTGKAIDFAHGRYYVKLSNGKCYWVANGRLKGISSTWTTKDYSTQSKENFVNSKGYTSKSKYLIWISQYTQRVIVYQGKKGNWKVIRSAKCATGTAKHRTPMGVHKITRKSKGWFYKTTYEKPVVYFKGSNAFHSRIHNYKGGYADATIGKPKSHGCVRLYDQDIQWIYKNCPKGTTVVSY